MDNGMVTDSKGTCIVWQQDNNTMKIENILAYVKTSHTLPLFKNREHQSYVESEKNHQGVVNFTMKKNPTIM
jgi:hypothetical protein